MLVCRNIWPFGAHILNQLSEFERAPCSIIFCEAAAIYGVIVAIILQTKIEKVGMITSGPEAGLYPSAAMFAGYAVMAAGLTTGFANLVCGCAFCNRHG